MAKANLSGYAVKNIGSNRGRPRIWLQQLEVSKAGLAPGDKYEIKLKEGSIILVANPDGSRVVTGKQPKREGDPLIPVIDLNSESILALFDGMSAIRLVQFKGEIHLLPLASELRKKERTTRLRTKMRQGIPLSVGSISHGAGFLTHALHQGLAEAGVPTRLAFANEIRPELLEHAARVNDAWDKDTIPIAAPMQELAFDQSALERLPRVEIAEAGIPCSGASISGRAKLGTAMPEEHPEVGHLVVAALVIVARVNPAMLLLENVVPYASSASAAILRNQLRDLGYVTHERTLDGGDFNALEHRKRWFMVAATEGMSFDWDMLQMPEKSTDLKLSDMLEDIPLNSSMWSEMAGLKAKEKRDIEAGKGFLMQVFTGDSERIGTLTKGYAKRRSTDPKIAHDTDPNLLRQLTQIEHARVKQQPEHLIEGLSATIAHEILGQSIIRDPAVATGRLMGGTILRFVNDVEPRSARELIDAIAAEITESAAFTVAELRAPLANVRYEGPVTVNELGAVVQDIGNGVGILHKSDALSHVRLGEVLSIQYPTKRGAPDVRNLSTQAPALSVDLVVAARQASQELAVAQSAFDFGSAEPASTVKRTGPRM